MRCCRMTTRLSSSFLSSVSRDSLGPQRRLCPVRILHRALHGRLHWMQILRSWVCVSTMTLSVSGLGRGCESYTIWNHICCLPELCHPPSGLSRVVALFFGRECTILRLRLVKDCAAWVLAGLRDAQKISTPSGVVFPCAFLDCACRTYCLASVKFKFNPP